MWRGKGWLPRHASRRGQRGHQMQIMFARVIFKNKLKKVKIKKLSESHNHASMPGSKAREGTSRSNEIRIRYDD
jgi:hypothetical protein